MQNELNPGTETDRHAELMACARLLALSVAEHRARFGVVPLSAHADQLDVARDAQASRLPDAAATVFDEALHMVRVPAPSLSGLEKRRQLRISVTAPVQLSDPDNRWLIPATITNIAWGGAAVRCKGLKGEIDQRVCLHLPAGRGGQISILATILRIDRVQDEPVYGLRFESLAPEDEERLQKVLQILMASPQNGERRQEARLVQRLDIEYGDAGEFRATLEDISASGLMLTVPEALEINQSLLVSLTSSDTPFNLSLRARVMHQTMVGTEHFRMYRIGLQFEHPDLQVKQRVAAVLQQLASLPSLGNTRGSATLAEAEPEAQTEAEPARAATG